MDSETSRRQWDRVARLLCEWPGVVGVFYGVRRRRGRWLGEQVLSVHVQRKRPMGEIESELKISPRIDGVPIDIIGVGRPRLFDSVDCYDRLRAVHDKTSSPRRSAISALAVSTGSGMLALGSGHGLLPRSSKGFQSGGWSVSSKKYVRVEDPHHGTRGFVVMGKVAHNIDYGLVSFPDLKPPYGVAGHMLNHGRVAWSSTPPACGAVVQHVSPTKKSRFMGNVVCTQYLGGGIRFGRSPYSVTHSKLIVVAASSGPFSYRGDSASLVFNSTPRAIGFVVGGAKTQDRGGHITYVLTDFVGLRREIESDRFNLFFERGPS